MDYIMDTEKRDEEENFSEGSEYVPEASPEKRKIIRKYDESIDESIAESSTSTKHLGHHLRKYIRLKGRYNDNYRKLLNTVIFEASHPAEDNDSENLNPMLNLPPSSYCATNWSAEDKTRLYRALARYGRDDLPRIASSVNKSEQEVQVYLEDMQKALLQYVRTCHGGLKSAANEMHAAVEVSGQCQEELDICADALAWYQFTWDTKQEHREHGDFWLLDKELADEIEMVLDDDEDGEESEHDGNDEGGNETSTSNVVMPNPVPAAKLLNISNLIELSQKVFMNSTDPDWDWRSFQDAGKPDKLQSKLSKPEKSPAIFRTAFDDFHRVAITLTKRIMHASIFLATSRLRAKDNMEQPLIADPRVERRDVLGALQILNLKENSFEHWATLPQRHKLAWYYQTDTDNKAKNRQVTADEAERYLRHKGRINHTEVEQFFQAGMPEKMTHPNSHCGHGQSSPQNLTRQGSRDSAEPVEPLKNEQISTPQRRHVGCKDSVDTYDHHLELLDRQASRIHEREIWNLLEKDAPSAADLADVEIPRLPKAIPIIEQGTSSFADWRAWTERRAEWEMEEDGTSSEEDWHGMDAQQGFEEGITLSWISPPQTSHPRHEESYSSVEADDSVPGVDGRSNGWTAVNNPGGNKRKRMQSTGDLVMASEMDLPLRKRQVTESSSEMEGAEPLGDEPAWTKDIQPFEDEPGWNRSPSPAESLGEIIDPNVDYSE